MQKSFNWQRFKPLFKQFFAFGVVGVITLIGNSLVFFLLRFSLGTQLANFITLVLMTIINSFLNKKFTFKNTKKDSFKKTLLVNLTSFGIYWVTTGVSLLVFTTMFPQHNDPLLETFVVLLASCIGTILKFLLFRQVYFANPSSNIKAFRRTKRSRGTKEDNADEVKVIKSADKTL